MDINQIVAYNIKKKRKEKKMTQEELAFLAGLHRSYICQIESAKKSVTVKTLEAIAKVFGVTVSYLCDASIAIS